MFEPKENGTVYCKNCVACKYCNKEKTLGKRGFKCVNPTCIFKCPGCDEWKLMRKKNIAGGLYEHVCKDCSSCERCGSQMWDYICGCRV